jgi:hypothetical protein
MRLLSHWRAGATACTGSGNALCVLCRLKLREIEDVRSG